MSLDATHAVYNLIVALGIKEKLLILLREDDNVTEWHEKAKAQGYTAPMRRSMEDAAATVLLQYSPATLDLLNSMRVAKKRSKLSGKLAKRCSDTSPMENS